MNKPITNSKTPDFTFALPDELIAYTQIFMSTLITQNTLIEYFSDNKKFQVSKAVRDILKLFPFLEKYNKLTISKALLKVYLQTVQF